MHQLNRNSKSILIIGLTGLLSSQALSEPFTYQGQLMDAGVPANGNYDMVFQLADSASGGFALAVDSVNNVAVTDGVFTVEIDFPSSLMNSSSRWIAITVEGTPLTPRVRMRETPRALNAVRANSAGTIETPLTVTDSATAMITSQNTSTGFNVSALLGRITSTSPGGFSAGVRGENNGTGFTGVGIYGSQDGFGYGVYGTTPGGIGVYGDSDNGFGLWGQSDVNTGLYAQTNSGAQAVQALHNDSDSEAFLATEFQGVVGRNLNTTFGSGVGVLGEGGRYGVQGIAHTNAGSGNLIGVLGDAGSSTADADNVFGVIGLGEGATGFAGATTIYGVYGNANIPRTSDTAYGLYGRVNGDGRFGPNAYAGYFEGDVHVTGTLSKTAGSFKIDHPLDPENMYLSHSFVESPDMMNIYNGIITLDPSGTAVVELPDYFETLNRNFRYQLTAIGASMPGLYISSEVSTNSFAIAGGVPNARVSWEITGVRQDPAALHHPIIVEQDKPEQHKGKYLNPQAYGFENDKGMHSAPSEPLN